MPNIASIIKQKNTSLLRGTNDTEQQNCNCKKKEECILQGECTAEAVVYTATVNHDDRANFYHGLPEGPVKARISKHYTSF